MNCKSNAENLQKMAKTRKIPAKYDRNVGADGRNRTGDLILTKDALYHLSYISMFRRTKAV